MWDFINKLKLGYLNRKSVIEVRNHWRTRRLLWFLLKHGYIKKFNSDDAFIQVWLRYVKNKPLLQEMKTVTRPGNRRYITVEELKKLNNRLGTKIFILETSKGFFTHKEALKLNCGGHLLLELTF